MSTFTFTSAPLGVLPSSVRAREVFKPEDFKNSNPGREEEAAAYYNKTLYRGAKKNETKSVNSPWAKMKEAVRGRGSHEGAGGSDGEVEGEGMEMREERFQKKDDGVVR
ncbi:hypothetical protein BDV97DRAFT_396020 [Delphinella strobiligena]|nr:hypothetical protein BDV97DRAFT_396020 [Delphinella strobiligena]